MSELSPAAKAVMIAATNGNTNVVNDPVYRQCIAAALRAAANQVVSSVPPPCEDFDEYAQGFLAAHTRYHAKLLAIVTELENHQ